MGKVPYQYIITHDGAPDDATKAVLKEFQALGRLQDAHFNAVGKVLSCGKRINETYEKAADDATRNLHDGIRAFAQMHGLRPKGMVRYLGGEVYPHSEESVPIFNADFTTHQAWSDALHEPIGDMHKRARILPANMRTADALRLLERSGALPPDGHKLAVVEVSDRYAEPLPVREEAVGNTALPVIGVHPAQVAAYLCQDMGLQDTVTRGKTSVHLSSGKRLR